MSCVVASLRRCVVASSTRWTTPWWWTSMMKQTQRNDEASSWSSSFIKQAHERRWTSWACFIVVVSLWTRLMQSHMHNEAHEQRLTSWTTERLNDWTSWTTELRERWSKLNETMKQAHERRVNDELHGCELKSCKAICTTMTFIQDKDNDNDKWRHIPSSCLTCMRQVLWRFGVMLAFLCKAGVGVVWSSASACASWREWSGKSLARVQHELFEELDQTEPNSFSLPAEHLRIPF